jgi:acyl-CoA thioesterase
LDLTIHYRRELPLSSASPDDYYLGRFVSHMSHDGFFEEDGELWTEDGLLIAQSRQLALSIPIKRS